MLNMFKFISDHSHCNNSYLRLSMPRIVSLILPSPEHTLPEILHLSKFAHHSSVTPLFFPQLRNLIHQSRLDICNFKTYSVKWASLMVQWWRICLPMQGTQVRSSVQEDLTCLGANKPVCHNYWARVLELMSCSYKTMRLEPVLCNKRSLYNEKPAHCS